MAKSLPQAWIAEARAHYARLGELYAERRDLAARVANRDQQIEETHRAIEHLAQTAALAAAAVDSAKPRDAAQPNEHQSGAPIPLRRPGKEKGA